MIEVRTILNPELVRKFHTRQSKLKTWIPIGIMILFYVLAFVTVVADTHLAVTLMLAAVGTLFPFAFMLAEHLLYKLLLVRAEAFADERTQIWRFFDDIVLFNETGKGITPYDKKFVYADIRKVKERKDVFYLTVGEDTYILDAKGFTVGSRRELHDCLIGRIAGKYTFRKKIYQGK